MYHPGGPFVRLMLRYHKPLKRKTEIRILVAPSVGRFLGDLLLCMYWDILCRNFWTSGPNSKIQKVFLIKRGSFYNFLLLSFALRAIFLSAPCVGLWKRFYVMFIYSPSRVHNFWLSWPIWDHFGSVPMFWGVFYNFSLVNLDEKSKIKILAKIVILISVLLFRGLWFIIFYCEKAFVLLQHTCLFEI